MENSDVILKLVQIQQQLRFLHWQTKSFAKHKAYGEIYSSLDELIDTFAESCMGKHGRPSFSGGYTIQGSDISELSMQEFIDDTVSFLVGLTEKYDPKMDSDLLNLRDEMLGEFNKLKYLLTLK
jgi:DNA-binding ferritin-like protein